MYDICIIGGGASGVFCAINAFNKGYKVCIIEAYDKPLKKLLATGNGRCNLSNKFLNCGFYNTDFVNYAINRFDYNKCKQEFLKLGLVTKEEEGRLYPFSESATNVQAVLLNNLERSDVKVFCGFPVKYINMADSGYNVYFGNSNISCKRVVLASGSHATLGKNSNNLLVQFGHSESICFPSLCQIPVLDNSIDGFSNVRCDVLASVIIDGKIAHKERGEMLFKKNALSGIVSFNLSSAIARNKAENAFVEIDFAPDLSEDDLFELLKMETIKNYGFLPFCIAEKLKTNNFVNIKKFRVKVGANKDYKISQVVSGGLNTQDFDDNTMQSKLKRGLYAIGEALDVDGNCGGYNLHWAWASAFCLAEGIKD